MTAKCITSQVGKLVKQKQECDINAVRWSIPRKLDSFEYVRVTSVVVYLAHYRWNRPLRHPVWISRIQMFGKQARIRRVFVTN